MSKKGPSSPITAEEFKAYVNKYLEIKKELFDKTKGLLSDKAKNFLFGQNHEAAKQFEDCKPEIQFVFTQDMLKKFSDALANNKANGVIITLGAWGDNEESSLTKESCHNRPTVMSSLCNITTDENVKYKEIIKLDINGEPITGEDNQLVAYENPLGSSPCPKGQICPPTGIVAESLLRHNIPGDTVNGEIPLQYLNKKMLIEKLKNSDIDVKQIIELKDQIKK